MPIFKFCETTLECSFSRVFLVGILNVTPDSFSDGGKFLDPNQALDRAIELQEEGADFIDVGAESTRPHALPVEVLEQEKRLFPLLNRLSQSLKIPISLDTRSAKIAERGIDAGVSILNDVSGFQHDPRILEVLSKTNVGAVLMHSRGTPESMHCFTSYDSVLLETDAFFKERLNALSERGIDLDRILLDPGIGFAKQGDQNLELLSNLKKFLSHDRPVLVGLSRKSFLADYSADGVSLQGRQTVTEIAHAMLAFCGVHFLRVHDVGLAKKTLRWVSDWKKKECDDA